MAFSGRCCCSDAGSISTIVWVVGHFNFILRFFGRRCMENDRTGWFILTILVLRTDVLIGAPWTLSCTMSIFQWFSRFSTHCAIYGGLILGFHGKLLVIMTFGWVGLYRVRGNEVRHEYVCDRNDECRRFERFHSALGKAKLGTNFQSRNDGRRGLSWPRSGFELDKRLKTDWFQFLFEILNFRTWISFLTLLIIYFCITHVHSVYWYEAPNKY